MFGFRDPEQAAAVIVGIAVTVAIVVGGAIANRHTIGAVLNFVLARPIYLARLKLNDTREWEKQRHSPGYIAAYKQSLVEIEGWLRAEEPELVTS